MEFNTVVVLPAGTKTRESPDFVRKSEYGDLPCFINPSARLIYQYWNPREQINGMVTAHSCNNVDGEWRYLTDFSEQILPSKFYIKNGIVKLNVTDSGVGYYAWDDNHNDYVLMNTFDLGNVIYLKINVLNFNVIQIQVNDTIWTLRQGRPYVYVQHPYTNLDYSVLGMYKSDGILLVPSGNGTTIPMQTTYYSYTYNLNNLVSANCATGTNYQTNKLTKNQSNCCEDGTTTGLQANGTGSSIAVEVGGAYQGNNCCVLTTTTQAVGECATSPYNVIQPDKTYYARVRLKGTGTVVFGIYERDSGGTVIHNTQTTTITLTSSWVEYTVSHITTDGVTANLKVITTSAQNATVYIDSLYFSDVNGTWVEGEISYFGSNGVTTSSSADWSVSEMGNKSCKITCPGTQVGERAWAQSQSGYIPVPGKTYTALVKFKGTAGEQFIVTIQQINSPYTVMGSQAVTATGVEQTVVVSGVCPEGATSIGALIRKDPTISTNPFYIGEVILVEGDKIPSNKVNPTARDIRNNLFTDLIATGTDLQPNRVLKNASNGCEDGTTYGFYGSGGGIISATTTEKYAGSYSLKVETPNIYGDEGMSITPSVSVIPGQTVYVRARLKGSGTVRFQLIEENGDGLTLNYVWSDTITLTSSWVEHKISLKINEGSFSRFRIATPTQQSATFYVDNIIVSDTDISWVEGGSVFGYGALTGSTLAQSYSNIAEGGRSLKVSTPGSVVAEGVYTNFSTQAGVQYTVKFSMVGTAGQEYRIYMDQNSAPWQSFFSEIYKVVTATGGVDTHTFTGTCPAGVTGGTFKVATNSARVDTFYLDELIVVRGTEFLSFDMDTATGKIISNNGMFFVKTAPVNIAVDSLPSDDITVIGHYDKTITQGYNELTNLSKECFVQVTQYGKPYRVY